jgi:hypothetical protein
VALSVGNYRLTLGQMVDHAVARCKIPRQKLTGEHQVIAKEALGFALAELSNKTVPLWCQERVLLPLYQQEGTVQLPPGTVDILPDSCFWRLSTRVGDSYSTNSGGVAARADDGDLTTSLVQTSTNGAITAQFLSATVVNLVGFMANGDQWHNLVFEASNDGITYTLVQTIAAPFGQVQTLYPDKQWVWYEVASPPAGGSLFFRVRETGGGTLSVRELYLGTAPLDLPMARLNREQYLTLPNKAFSGRPLQFWLSRDLNPDGNFAEQPTMYLWPVPGNESTFAQVFLMRHRYIADIQDFNNPVELPVRWYDAVIWWLASYFAAELPDVPQDREVYLMAKAKEEIGEALDEERDNSPILIQADISAYTR